MVGFSTALGVSILEAAEAGRIKNTKMTQKEKERDRGEDFKRGLIRISLNIWLIISFSFSFSRFSSE